MIERERTRHAARVEHGERDGVAQRPVLVDVSRENVFGALLLGGQHGDDRKAAREQPLTRHGPPKFPEQERMRLGLDVVRDEARPPLGGDGASDVHRARMIGVVGATGRRRQQEPRGVPLLDANVTLAQVVFLERATPGWHSSPRGRRGSLIEDPVLVARPGRVPATSPGTDEAKNGVVVGQRRNVRGAWTTRAAARRVCWYEATTTPANARQFAALDEAPHGRA